MNPDAPYYGGFSPGAAQFAVDGDFSQLAPCGPPIVSYPMKGDSVFSNLDIIYLDYTLDPPGYTNIPLGTAPNLQPWSSNQKAIIIDQEFMVALSLWTPIPLNTPYDITWSIGWVGTLSNSQPTQSLSDAILVEIGELQDMGMGIVKIKLKYATIPPTRNEIEQFSYIYPGLTNSPGRLSFSNNGLSRLQYDYFVFDDFDILSTPLFPAGNRLDATTGLYGAPDFILQPQKYYSPIDNAVTSASFLPSDGQLSDPPSTGTDPGPGSTPTNTQWTDWIGGNNTSTGTTPEIVAEGSTLRRLMGNIFERRTRFVLLD